MGLAQDLFEQAVHLARYEGPNPTQAALRRAVSTAYYALFHLVVDDAAHRWNGSDEALTGIQRAFNHGQMKSRSALFDRLQWKDWNGITQTIPTALQRVARAFIYLQEERHTADYDNHEEWGVTDVQTVLNKTELAFRDWLMVRSEPIAGNYLLYMLLGNSRG